MTHLQDGVCVTPTGRTLKERVPSQCAISMTARSLHSQTMGFTKPRPGCRLTAEKELLSLGKRESPLAHQVEILRKATGLEITVDTVHMTALMEMSLVESSGFIIVGR